MNVYKTRATNSLLRFVHPNTGSDTQGMVNRWSVVERGLSQRETFKQLYTLRNAITSGTTGKGLNETDRSDVRGDEANSKK